MNGGTTKKPLLFFWRDGLGCLLQIMGNPVFQGRMQFKPRRVYSGKSRLYGEIMSGDMVWELQVCTIHIDNCATYLPTLTLIILQGKIGEGETLGLVMIASDKTHLTTHQGDKEAHCVYLSCGNVEKSVRGKASARAWMLIGYIPIAKFKEVAHQGILSDRLYHACMDILTESLKCASRKAVAMVDCYGHMRMLRTFAIALLVDRPEQHVISVTAGNQSPLSDANHSNYGDGMLHPLRTGKETLAAIAELLEEYDADDLQEYKLAAFAVGLNGVTLPFWRDWENADPCRFLTPDALHQWYKFFMDHLVKWARAILGDKELDKRLSVLQPRVGFRHFVDGFTRFKQHTGREQRDIMRVFVVVLSGNTFITPKVMKAFRSFVDFVYIAQYESHSEDTLIYLDQALRDFHDNKAWIAALGVRDGPRKKQQFNIPKLETFQHVVRFIRDVGSVEQFSSDQTERLHMTSKAFYRASNRKEFVSQMCLSVDRDEKVALFAMWVEWKSSDEIDLEEDIDEDDLQNLGGYDPLAARLQRLQIKRVADRFMPQPVPDRSLSQAAEKNDDTAFFLINRTPRKSQQAEQVAKLYRLPDFPILIQRYFDPEFVPPRRHPGDRPLLAHLPCKGLDCWDSVRMQMTAVHDDTIFMPPLTVLATPPKTKTRLPDGRYNFVLVKEHRDARMKGIRGTHLHI